MTIKKRELATTFGNVAGDKNSETNINNNTNISSKDSNNTDVNADTNSDDNHNNTISDIVSRVSSSKKDQPKKRQIAIYIDESVAKEFDKFGKKNGKGSKSELIEELLRAALK